MLLNNFKPLLYFDGEGSIIDVTGTTRVLKDIIQTAYVGLSVNNGTILRDTPDSTVRAFTYPTTVYLNTLSDVTEDRDDLTYALKNVWEEDTYIQMPSGDSPHERLNIMTLFLGSGTTPPTMDDYQLEQPLNITIKNSSCWTTKQGKLITERTFYNDTEEDITISEIGLFVYKINIKPSGNVRQFMIGRKVLKNPVIIPVGEARMFDYTIDMSNIDFSEADN